MIEARERANPSYSKREVSLISREIATKFFQEFEKHVLSHTDPMKEDFERTSYLKVVQGEFVWTLSPETKGILSGEMTLLG